MRPPRIEMVTARQAGRGEMKRFLGSTLAGSQVPTAGTGNLNYYNGYVFVLMLSRNRFIRTEMVTTPRQRVGGGD